MYLLLEESEIAAGKSMVAVRAAGQHRRGTKFHNESRHGRYRVIRVTESYYSISNIGTSVVANVWKEIDRKCVNINFSRIQ